MANLTLIEIGAQAVRMGHQDLADWIVEEQVRREEAAKAHLTEPLVTDVGTIEVGPRYNIWFTLWNKSRKLKNVGYRPYPERVTTYGGIGEFVYKSGAHVLIYREMRITKIESNPPDKE